MMTKEEIKFLKLNKIFLEGNLLVLKFNLQEAIKDKHLNSVEKGNEKIELIDDELRRIIFLSNKGLQKKVK